MLALLLVTAAAAFDHTYAGYQAVLTSRVSGGRVDYSGLKAAPAALDAFVAEVSAAPVASFSASQKKAFYINAYNALTLDLIADNYPLASILDLDGGKVWDTRSFSVGGERLTLNAIENTKLRTLGDPRIHAAINCAAVSCPPLQSRAFVAESLEAQLDTATRAWVSTMVSTMNVSGGVISVSKIFEWFSVDFARYGGTAQAAALGFIGAYAPADKAAAVKAAVEVRFLEYDWKLNGR